MIRKAARKIRPETRSLAHLSELDSTVLSALVTNLRLRNSREQAPRLPLAAREAKGS
jgi:hypothetical protein